MTGDARRGSTFSHNEPEKDFPTNLSSFSIGAKLGTFLPHIDQFSQVS